ncbi:GTP cyclohydrolase 1 feedback regulatory protein [Natator depressus]|uniref:GTP cyclohydrolase 1 feedback regulatory protein n=1 Tax=Natator depressus TaxID=27790 RepID=UPI003EBB1889
MSSLQRDAQMLEIDSALAESLVLSSLVRRRVQASPCPLESSLVFSAPVWRQHTTPPSSPTPLRGSLRCGERLLPLQPGIERSQPWEKPRQHEGKEKAPAPLPPLRCAQSPRAIGCPGRGCGRGWPGCHVWEAKLGLEAEAEAERERWALDSTLGPGVAGIMPYVLISTQIRMEVGPTMVGDEHSDQHLMDYLGAIKRNMLGNHFWEYYVNDAPRIVLDKLEKYGYRVVSMTGVGQTLVWCLHKE